jgi:hypothetical protein
MLKEPESSSQNAPRTMPKVRRPSPGRPGTVTSRDGLTAIEYSPCRNKGKIRWHVFIGLDPVTGKRRFSTFSTETEAIDYAGALAEGKAPDRAALRKMSPSLLRQLCVVATLLEPFCKKLGIAVTQAVDEYIRAKGLAGNLSLQTIADEALSRPWLENGRTPLSAAAADFIRDKQAAGYAPETLRRYTWLLGDLVEQTGDLAVSAIGKEQLDPAVNRPTWGQTGRKNAYSDLNSFYTWLWAHLYIDPNAPRAIAAVERPKADSAEPKVISVPIATQALRVLAMQAEPPTALTLALGLFAGIQPRELPWVLRNLASQAGAISLPADASATPRTVPILPVLDSWLAPFRAGLATLASTALKRPLLPLSQVLEANDIDWTQWWLHHSFCAYRLAQSGDLPETSHESAQKMDVMLARHRDLVTPSQAAAYFALTPARCGIADWADRVAQWLAATPR